MKQLEVMVTMMVASVRHNHITIGALRARLLREGMDREEATLLLEVVALEVRLDPPNFTMVQAIKAYKSTGATKVPHTIDMVG